MKGKMDKPSGARFGALAKRFLLIFLPLTALMGAIALEFYYRDSSPCELKTMAYWLPSYTVTSRSW